MTRRGASQSRNFQEFWYNDDWFDQIDSERRSLQVKVSKKEFEWLEINDENNNWD